jgi:uncharacterized protein YggE
VLVAMAFAGSAWGQIRVVGEGEASAPTAKAVLPINLIASGPLAADAQVKYQSAKAETIESLKQADIPNLNIVETGNTVRITGNNQQMMQVLNGQIDPNTMPTEVLAMETIECVLDGLDKLEPGEAAKLVSKLTDTAREKNLSVGQPMPTSYIEMQIASLQGNASRGTVTFLPGNPDALRDEAFQNAINDARKAAAALAKRANLKLGPIVAIDATPRGEGMTPWGIMAGSQTPTMTGTLDQCTMKVSLLVTFAVE